ncbi:gliding motility lipoprotein GldH [Salinivirga cyanobacteriivorans]
MKNVSLLLFVMLFAFFGCDRNSVFDQYSNMSKEQWHMDSLKHFQFNIDDSLAIYSMYLNIRNTGEYGYSNLIIFADTDLPGEQHIRDTINCILADDKGEWLGSGFGSIWTNKIPYKTRVRFPRTGKYELTLQHGMREEELEGITDIGVRIEKLN